MTLNVLVCVKRVPATGARILLEEDGQEIDTHNLGFTISPHEECAVEEAVQIIENHGGTVTVLTLGPEAATEQLRESLALGADRGILLVTDGNDWGPMPTSQAIVQAIQIQQEEDSKFDILLFGNDSADSGGYQVGIRVAHALDLPCITSIKALTIENGMAQAQRETDGGWEIYEVALPAVFTVKEGINLPRYPSLPGKLRAKKKPIENIEPMKSDDGLKKVILKLPAEQDSEVEILGTGPDAVPKIIEILDGLELI